MLGAEDYPGETPPPEIPIVGPEVSGGGGAATEAADEPTPDAAPEVAEPAASETNAENDKIDYEPTGFWHGPAGDLPIKVLDRPKEDAEGKQWVQVRWWSGEKGEETGQTWAPLEEVMMVGQRGVTVKRGNIMLGRDWEVVSIATDHTPIATVRRYIRTGKDNAKPQAVDRAVRWDRLWESEHPEKVVVDQPIPVAVLAAAGKIGATPDVLEATRQKMDHASWEDTLGFLQTVQRDDKLRGHMERWDGVRLSPPAAEEQVQNTPLKTLLEIPEEEVDSEADTEKERAEKIQKRAERRSIWAAEKARREQAKLPKLDEMLTKYEEFIPQELMLLPYREVPYNMFMPDDPEGAYGVWRRLKIEEYKRRIRDPEQVAAVRAEIKKVGGPIPLVRRIGVLKLAWDILQTEKRELRTSGRDANFGALGFGMNQLLHNVRALKNYNERATDALRGLGLKNRPTYTKAGQGTPRRDIAEEILTLRQQELAHQKGHLDPHIPRKTDDRTKPVKEEHGSVEMVS